MGTRHIHQYVSPFVVVGRNCRITKKNIHSRNNVLSILAIFPFLTTIRRSMTYRCTLGFLFLSFFFFELCGDSAKQKIEKLWRGENSGSFEKKRKSIPLHCLQLFACRQFHLLQQKKEKEKTSFFGVPFGYHSCHMTSFIFFRFNRTLFNYSKQRPKASPTHIDIVLQMITSLANKIHKLPSITVARVNLSIHRNKSFSLPTMSERFLLYNTWMTRWNLSVGTVLTFPARLLFFFTWTKLWEPPEGTIYKLTEEKPLRPSPTESGGWGSATAAPADHFIFPVSQRKQIPKFSRLTHCCGLGRRVHTCVGFSWVRRAGYCEVSISFAWYATDL